MPSSARISPSVVRLGPARFIPSASTYVSPYASRSKLLGRPAGAFGYSFFQAASHLTMSGAFEPGRYGISEKPMTPSAVLLATITSPGSTMLLPTKKDCFRPFFFPAEDGIRDLYVTGVQTCALPI